jgi:glucose-1-phosphate cytidylyltransferase
MKTVILAGGLGTRLREETEYRPKPMVIIGKQPILWHLMNIYSTYSHNDFIICTGYKSEVIKNYFHGFKAMSSDFTLEIGSSNLQIHGSLPESNWTVTITDTGASTMTGGRLFQSKKYLNNDTFMCTYGDGLADININDLIDFHKSHGKIATVTCVQPPSRFGVLRINQSNQVSEFLEKPKTSDWVNGGFFVFEPEIFDYLGPNSILEHEPISNLVRDGELMAYPHRGYWQSMDTHREVMLLNELWESGEAPWKIW